MIKYVAVRRVEVQLSTFDDGSPLLAGWERIGFHSYRDDWPHMSLLRSPDAVWTMNYKRAAPLALRKRRKRMF